MPPRLVREIFSRQTHLLFAHARAAILTALGVGVIYLGLMWPVVEASWLMSWWAAIFLASLARLAHVAAYFKANPAAEEAPRWSRQYMWGAGAAGVLWGAAGVLFMPADHPYHQMVTLMLLMGLTAAAVTTYASNLPVYRLFLWLAITPLTLGFLARMDMAGLAAGLVALIYAGMMSQRAAVMVNTTITDSLRSSLEVAGLLALNTDIINHTDSGITVYQPSGECVLMNESAIRILGLPPNMDASHNFRTTAGWQEHGLVKMAEIVLQGGMSKALDLPMRSIYGWEMWITARLHRITQDGEPRLLVVFTEISPQRHPQ